MKQALLSLLILFTTASSFAHKSLGGGNGVGGTLLDLSSAGHEVRLEGPALYKLVATQYASDFARFPYLARTVEFYVNHLKAKMWYTDDRALAAECVDQTTTELKKEIWACQNDVEVRIRESWWLTAPAKTRAALILHEVLTAMRLSDGGTNAVPAMVAAFSNAAASDDELKDSFFRLGFGYLYARDEIDLARHSLDVFNAGLSRQQNQTEANQWFSVQFAKAEQDLKATTDGRVLILISDAEWLVSRDHYGPSPVPPIGWSDFVLWSAYHLRAVDPKTVSGDHWPLGD